jgi:hypothetical protein
MYARHQQLFLLAYIDKHIVEGKNHIAAIKRIIADGESQRFDMAEAKLKLTGFVTAQAQRQAHREQVLRELGE